jgi:hypothetical protein
LKPWFSSDAELRERWLGLSKRSVKTMISFIIAMLEAVVAQLAVELIFAILL